MMGGMAGPYLIVDLGQQPPAIVDAGQVLPAAIADALAAIDGKLEQIMSDQAAEQAELNDMGTAMQAVADHVSSASANLGAWIAQQQAQPAAAALDFTGANTALASLQAADATLGGIVPQAPAVALDPAVPDPGPAPDAPVDPSAPVDPGAPSPSG